MKTRVLHILAAVAAFLTLFAGLDLTGVISVLPLKVAAWATIAIPSLTGLVHVIKVVGDFIDDGQINGSFKCHPVALVAAVAVSVFAGLGLTSCVTTTAPDGTVTKAVDQQAVEQGASLVERFYALFKADSTTVIVTPTK